MKNLSLVVALSAVLVGSGLALAGGHEPPHEVWNEPTAALTSSLSHMWETVYFGGANGWLAVVAWFAFMAASMLVLLFTVALGFRLTHKLMSRLALAAMDRERDGERAALRAEYRSWLKREGIADDGRYSFTEWYNNNMGT